MEWKRLPYLSPFKLRWKYIWSTCLSSPHFCLNQRHLLQIKRCFSFLVKSQWFWVFSRKHLRKGAEEEDAGGGRLSGSRMVGNDWKEDEIKDKEKNDAGNIIPGESEGNSFFFFFPSVLYSAEELLTPRPSFTAEFFGWKFLCKISGRSSFFFSLGCFNFFLIWSALNSVS